MSAKAKRLIKQAIKIIEEEDGASAVGCYRDVVIEVLHLANKKFRTGPYSGPDMLKHWICTSGFDVFEEELELIEAIKIDAIPNNRHRAGNAMEDAIPPRGQAPWFPCVRIMKNKILTKVQAQQKAKELIKELGKGWKATVYRVHYPPFWRYDATIQIEDRNIIKVFIGMWPKMRYGCQISSNGVGVNNGTLAQSIGHHSPVKAVQEAFKYARNDVRTLTDALQTAEALWSKTRSLK
jgi:hypothetical protein